ECSWNRSAGVIRTTLIESSPKVIRGEVGLSVAARPKKLTKMQSAFRAVEFWRPSARKVGRRLPVLLYHHVGPLRPGTIRELTVSSKKFDRQVRWLAHLGYVGIRPSDWLRWLRERAGLPEKAVLFTFDDGYSDLTEHALPTLQRYGFGAVVFVVTGQLE